MTTKTKKNQPDFMSYKNRKKGVLVHPYGVIDDFGFIVESQRYMDASAASTAAKTMTTAARSSDNRRYFPVRFAATVLK